MKLTTLGTSCMFPTKKRNHPAMLLFHNGEYLLFDVGEGTQRQLRIAGISPMNIDYIFITHWHGDHTLGLGGMLQCFSGNRRTKKVVIIGPKTTKTRVQNIIDTYDFTIKFPIEIKEIISPFGIPKEVIRIKDMMIYAMRVRHGTPCLSYYVKEDDKRKINLEYTKKFGLVQHPLLGKLQAGEDIVYNGHKITVEKGTFLKKGKKFCYITDTSYMDQLIDFAKDSDILLCESTYLSDLESEAIERKHMTALQAGILAQKANVKKLILTHFSQRYTSTKKFVEEASKYFKNVVAANDFDVFEF